jgi:hypothetical protein
MAASQGSGSLQPPILGAGGVRVLKTRLKDEL